MAIAEKVFAPVSWTPDTITVAATSASVALTGITKSEDAVRVFNGSTEVVYVSFTAGSGTATTSNTPIGIGATECFAIPPDVTYANAIGTGATGIIYFSVGKGA